ncbi:MAG: 1-(5-phosphoribosyl)-5-[(5-phosphoribosylamino)methylideneamino]imidazole-4-carboxamide isomerase [Selenomonadaceae bacterium]|nr:1-(5-phosphoribosyl)-5-[(5-phosphoribosylamino)methylideneamino]imidazole-4-carboxamide isomerase [Selenomonadaceae bacterium]
MKILPAIDIRGGKCVRLFKGDFEKETVFSDFPFEMAQKWESQGGEFLHLVDLDGARAGKPQNLTAVKEILANIKIPTELGGGIRKTAHIEEVLNLGISRVILGSVAVRNPALIRESCKNFGGDKVVVGIDAKNGVVAVDGWGVSGDIEAVELALRMKDAGVTTIIYTDISRDGTLTGVNAKETANIAKKSGLKVIASGGVSSIEDIRLLKQYESDGIEGVIVGKSIYTGALDLSEAIAVAKGGA